MKKAIENKDRIKQTHMTMQEAWIKYCAINKIDNDIKDFISLKLPINI